MFNFVGKVIGDNSAKFLADFFAVIFGSVGHAFKNAVMSLFGFVWNAITSWAWFICKWVLGIIDAMQLAFSRILGINLTDGTSLSLADYVEGMKEMTVSGGANYYDYILRIFRALFGVAIVLMIVFTIVAMVMQEYKLAVTGYQKADNHKGKFFVVILKNLLVIFLMPLIFYTIIVGTNSILTSFYRALGGYGDTTIAGNVLASATYDSNRYRAYANANKRIPITISVYSMDNVFGNPKSDDELKEEIQNKDVQAQLKAIAGAFANDSFLPFEKSTIYDKGTWSNYKNYSMTYNNTVYDDMGQYFENFICTREQYYVLADFVDYCQLHNIKYYVKAISESDICWKYVDKITYSQAVNDDGTANGDVFIDVTYRDAQKVNNPDETVNYASASSPDSGDEYKTLQITTKLDTTSPIADALKTASTILGIEDKTSSFNVMERDDSGDFVNLVQWSNRKTKLKLSDSFDLANPNNWTFSDQIIVYEYFRFQNDYGSTNNVLEDYTIAQLKAEGALIETLEMTYRHYNSNTETYSNEMTQYCVRINGNYYRVVESTTDFDDYGHAYFELDVKDRNLDYFTDATVTIERIGEVELELSENFDINDTSSWEFVDKVLVYEYFKDLSLSNGIRRTYQFTDFNYDAADNDPKFSYYSINNAGVEKYYLYINGTYYECHSDGTLIDTQTFLTTTASISNMWFGYKLGALTRENYGINNLNQLAKSSLEVGTVIEIEQTDAMYEKYNALNMKFSEDFSFYNTNTWTFRDYAIMYLYIHHFTVDNEVTENISIQMLHSVGIIGDIVRRDTSYYLRVLVRLTPIGGGTTYEKFVFIDLKNFEKVSEQKITKTISSTQFDEIGLSSSGMDFIESFNATTDLLLKNPVSSKYFELSENFDKYDARTWSIGDYLMLYLIDKAYIDTNIEMIQINGYTALCYDLGDDGNFYRFGIGNKSFYLNEKKINAMGYTTEKWFRTNLMSFLLTARFGGLTMSDISVGNEFAGGTIANAESYLLNIDEDFTDSASLQYVLAEDFLNYGDILTDMSAIEYSYYNPRIVADDLLTWNYLDTVIYIKTGALPSKENPFASYLYNYAGNVYLKVVDGFVKMDGGNTACFNDGAGKVLTNRIISNTTKIFTGDNARLNFDEYYNNRLKSLVYVLENASDINDPDKRNDVFGDEGELTAGTKVVYYTPYYNTQYWKATGGVWNVETGSLVANGFIKNAVMTEFDMVLATLGWNADSLDGYYMFETCVQKSTGNVYFKVDETHYVKLSTNNESSVYLQSNILTPSQDAAFRVPVSADGVGEATYTPNKSLYNAFDAVIYSIDKAFSVADNPITYNKYICNVIDKADAKDRTYLFVNGKIVRYDTTLNTYLGIDGVITDSQIKFLYENYFNKYVSSSSPSARAEYSFTSYVSTNFDYGDGIEQIKNFSGLAIILKYFSVRLAEGTSKIVEGVNGYYLKITSESDETRGETKYINLSDLGLVGNPVLKDGSGIVTSIRFNFQASHIEEFRWVFARVQTGSPSVLLNAEHLVDAAVKAEYHNSAINNKILDTDINTYRNTLNNYTPNSIGNWTWFGLISCYADPNNDYGVEKFYHYSGYGEGKEYYLFRNANSVFIVPFNFEGISVYDITSAISTNTAPFNAKSYSDISHTVGGSTKLKLILTNLGYSSVTTTQKFTSNYFGEGVDKINHFYAFTVNVGGENKYYAIYDLRGAEDLATSGGVKYIKEGATAGTFELTDTESTGISFIVSTKPLSEFAEWSMIDFVVSVATYSIYATTFASKIYVYDSNYYVKFEEQFILLPHLSNYDICKKDGGTFKITATSSMNLFTMLKNNYYDEVALSYESPLYGYNENATLRNKLDTYKSSFAEGSEKTKIKFSKTFDFSNYESWTVADYMIYYAFTKGLYAGESNEIAEFTYIPKFSQSGSTYYDLTYLDIVLAKIVGKDIYLSSAEVYDLALYYDSSSYLYYLKYSGHYIPISNDIYIDFENMEVASNKLNENFSSDAVQEKIEEFTDGPTQVYQGTSLPGTGVSYKLYFNDKNFQTFVNANYAPAQIGYVLKEDANTGSVETSKIINFTFTGVAISGAREFYDYDKFYELYNDYLVSYLIEEDSYTLDVKIEGSEASLVGVTDDMKINMVYDEVYPDLVFDNYYYFNLNATKLTESNLMNVSSSLQTPIKTGNLAGTDLQRKTVNLRLNANASGKFDIANQNNWHVLDFIILYEFSRNNVRHNAFKGMSVEELFTTNYYYTAFYSDKNQNDSWDVDDKVYLYLNNNFYDISKIVVWDDTNKVFKSNGVKISETSFNNGTATAVNLNGLVTDGSISSHYFKILYETYEFSINPNYKGNVTYTRHADNISYQHGGKTYFKELDEYYIYTNYRINVSNYATYSVKELIKKTSWVEKLMTDMQVYYPDLNWGILLATDGWLDTLGDFTSAHSNGLFVGEQNSANTTAAGLVLSEFFMSVATKVNNGIAEYEFSSVFDEDTIRALMMSLLGEENYQALVLEAEVFMDYFNTCFAPIIDDFAAEFGEDIGENSLRLNAYKSYLATLLLSSDIGEYLYTIATRVYAEYTIGEYLATAAGDYVGYYSYANQLKDDNGNIVDAYSYGSFLELVIYENEYCGNNNPVFTFNFKTAFEKYKDEHDKYLGLTYEQIIANETIYQVAAQEFFDKMDKEYKEIYSAGYDVSEQGIVVNKEGDAVSFYSRETFVYCYMLHVYWEIRSEVTGFSAPSYLNCYRQYLEGKLTRWNIIKGQNTDSADQYFEYYSSEESKLRLYKNKNLLSTGRLFMPTLTLSDGTDVDIGILNILGLFVELVTDPDDLENNVSIPIFNAKMICKDSGLQKDIEFIRKNSLSLYFTMCFSENSSFEIAEVLKEVAQKLLPLDLSTETCWNTINEYYDKLENIIAELQAVRELLPGETTPLGSSRLISDRVEDAEGYYTDMQLDSIINAFVNLRNNLDQYISTQLRIDAMQKRSITFTLAQYGANYVTTGFEFSVRNKQYTFKPTTDPLRLAEYVMGGAFLESVGEGAKYTSSEFTGIIKASKVYDNVDHTLKTQLDSWSELRRFLSKIADQTAELYFTTNLADLDIGKVNAIKLTDKITISGTYSGACIQESLYKFMAESIDRKIVYRLTGRTYDSAVGATNPIPAYTQDNFISIAQYVFDYEVDEQEFKDMTLEGFKRLAMKKIIDNEQNQDETPEERSAKYMILFNSMGLQVDLKAGTVELDRVLNESEIQKTGTAVLYKSNGTEITGSFRSSDNTLETIKVLSGLENRPTREVLIRQYEGVRAGDYYDEAFGDTFIACTYSNGLYYPILGSASKSVASAKYQAYVNDPNMPSSKFISRYYDGKSNVVVMKGIITANGYPTAIRKYNNPVEVLKKQLLNTTSEIYNAVTYYRTDIGTNFGEGKDLVNASRAVPKVSTKNYTKYLYNTSYTQGIGSTATYTGRTNLKTVVSSDYSANFVQARAEYLTGQADEFGAISVLDDFSYFYVFGGQSWILLVLAFVTIIPVMINACGGAAARIFDVLVLFIVSPVIISTNSLYPEGKNPTYKKWKTNLTTVAMSAFGYIIAFTAFSLLIPMIYSVDSYITVPTYNKIVSLGGLGGFFSYPTINSLVKCLWVITAVSVLEKMPELMLPIISANRGDISSPHPGLGSGAGKPFIQKTKNVVGSIRGEFKKVTSVISGKALMGLKEQAKDAVVGMVPFLGDAINLTKMAAGTIKGKIKDKEAKAVEAALKAYGIDAKTAKKLGNAVKEADKAREKQKAEKKKSMQNYKKDFQNILFK